MLVLHMMIGLPASGKSTSAQEIVSHHHKRGKQIATVSNDDVGQLLTGLAFCKHAGGFITASTVLLARCLLAQGTSVIVDNTCITRASRSKWFQIADEFEVKVIAHFVNVDPATVLKRNTSRGEQAVPIKVIMDMSERLEPPTMDEGFSEIKEYGN